MFESITDIFNIVAAVYIIGDTLVIGFLNETKFGQCVLHKTEFVKVGRAKLVMIIEIYLLIILLIKL